MGKAGRPVAIGADQFEALRSMVQTHRAATLGDLCRLWQERTDVALCTVTMRRALLRAGLQRQVVGSAAPEQAEAKPKRYGYNDSHRAVADASSYPSCLTDAEWALAIDLFELPAGSRGRPGKYPRRAMVDACCYVLRGGISWRMLPKSFPPWAAVHKAFSRWAAQGKFETLHDRFRAQWRERVERHVGPTAAVIDAQSTRISPQGGGQGFDAGKKVKGRKRHLVVDTLGLLLAVSVTAASVQDRDAAADVMVQACTKHPTIKLLYADSAYAGCCAAKIEEAQKIRVEIVRSPSRNGDWNDPQNPLWEQTTGFVILPKRWVVERTHAWVERSRRLVMHHDRTTVAATAWVWLSQARMLLRRLTTPESD